MGEGVEIVLVCQGNWLSDAYISARGGGGDGKSFGLPGEGGF